MKLDDALSQIAEIRQQIARSQTFRGYRSATTAFSAVMAMSAAAVQRFVLGEDDRQDYFGQTVNIAARVQSLADSRAIFTTSPVVNHAETAALLAAGGRTPVSQQRVIRGIAANMVIYEIT